MVDATVGKGRLQGGRWLVEWAQIYFLPLLERGYFDTVYECTVFT